MEDFEFSHIGGKSYMWYIACAGGLIGFALSTGLAYLTETDWPLPTGGMPIVSWWPNLIVMFELTMLGAILATVITLFITAKLPSRESKLYDPQVSDGKILVGVEHPDAGALPQIERALLAAGVADLKRG